MLHSMECHINWTIKNVWMQRLSFFSLQLAFLSRLNGGIGILSASAKIMAIWNRWHISNQLLTRTKATFVQTLPMMMISIELWHEPRFGSCFHFTRTHHSNTSAVTNSSKLGRLFFLVFVRLFRLTALMEFGRKPSYCITNDIDNRWISMTWDWIESGNNFIKRFNWTIWWGNYSKILEQLTNRFLMFDSDWKVAFITWLGLEFQKINHVSHLNKEKYQL